MPSTPASCAPVARLSTDVLRHVTRAAKRKREADSEYEQAIARAGRIGLSHREISTAAEVSHGTVRATLARCSASLNGNDQQIVTAAVAAYEAAAALAEAHSPGPWPAVSAAVN